MKLAAARAGAWFFGIIIFVMLFLNDMFKNKSLTEQIVTLLFFGFVAGGAAFFWTWHQVMEEDRELELAERRKALENDGSK
ncbi:MAG: hypothetical protein WBK76_05095 [Candidatus Saccharimonadales bacterium]